MNRWKISFFLLAGVIAAAIVYVFMLIGSVEESGPIPQAKNQASGGHALLVSASKEGFEGIANTFLQRAMEKEPLPVTIAIEDDIILASELTVFSYSVPVTMHFNPVVQEDGNLLLKQSSLELGALNLPPSTVLKVLRDSVELPEWMVVRAKEEEIFIDLSDLPISGDIQVKAKEFNLEKDEILLEITIPEDKEAIK